MDTVGGYIVHGLGLAVMIVATVGLIVQMISDIKKLLGADSPVTKGFGDVLAKLPAAYLSWTVTLLLGLFLWSPSLFGEFIKAAWPSS